MFHEAFAIVKHFIEIATNDTAEALQRFTNTRVPAPPNSTSLRLLVPMVSCNQAAAMLIEYFGEEEITKIVGGSRWWQVRGLKGVQGEWIAMSDDWKRAQKVLAREAKDGNDDALKKKARDVGLNKRHERKRSYTSMPKMPRMRSNKSVNRQSSHKEDGEKRQTESDSEHVLDEGKDEPLESFEELDRLKRVMYYIHGGGYYFGSINTHRVMIARFSRKFGGRAFAIQYRKSPQYPWPCPLQDILAGYLYLIDPPPEARHKAIDPAHIVIAGDSAGGGLALALLGVLRDLNKPMPAGAVLLSPWCDLTHSFPSILQNTETDIIPKYSFIHKPSTLWPVPGVRPEDKQKTATKKRGSEEDNNDASNPPGTTKSKGLFHKQEKEPEMAMLHGVEKDVEHGKAREDGELPNVDHYAVRKSQNKLAEESSQEQPVTSAQGKRKQHAVPEPLAHLYSEPITIPMEDKHDENVNIELRQQIQLYATNAQLYHPLCSPILQGSLGGLPPLYILAGDSEVLRDEIIYLAHRAARPQQYPLKKELLDASERCRQDADRFNSQPTKVHLQVYDGQPHVLTLFSFTTSSRYAYRAIASFVKHVTGAPTNVINPFPNLEQSTSLNRPASDAPSNPETHNTMVANPSKEKGEEKPDLAALDTSGEAIQTDEPEVMTPVTRDTSSGNLLHSSTVSSPVDAPVKGESLRQKRRNDVKVGIENSYDGQVPLRRPTYVQEMIRERVDIRGLLRPLEDEHLLQALQVPIEEIGKIKSGPVSRYLTGQELWDKKYKRTAKKVDKERAKNEARAQAMLEQAAREGLLESMPEVTEEKRAMQERGEQSESKWFQDGWADLAAFGPLDLQGEVPPPSAIAGRRDTPDALELIRQSLHMRAYRLQDREDIAEVATKVSYGSHRAARRHKTRVKLRQTAGSGYRQSASERQVESKTSYGLRAWGDAMNYFTGKSSEKTKARFRQYGRTTQDSNQQQKHTAAANGSTTPKASTGNAGSETPKAAEWVDSASAHDAPA